jgi:hypothetical protein
MNTVNQQRPDERETPDKTPETPTNEPKPAPVQDPPAEPDPAPYVVRGHQAGQSSESES